MAAVLHKDKYPCTECSEHFSTREAQAEHLGVQHASRTPWLCYWCPNSFATRDEWVAHMNSDHEGWTSSISTCFKCRNIVFSAAILKRHMQHDHAVPDGGADRTCKTCGFTNDSFTGLSLHVLHRHSTTDRCEWCGKAFAARHHFVMHAHECYAKPQRAPAHEFEPESKQSPNHPHPPLVLYAPATHGVATQNSLANRASAPIHSQADNVILRFQPPPTTRPDFCDPQGYGALHYANVKFYSPDRLEYAGSMFDLRIDFNPAVKWDRTAPTKKSYRECPPPLCCSDELLFRADPKMIAYGNILRLARTNTDQDIMEKSNAGRPVPVFRSIQAVQSRIHSAFKWSAEMRGDTTPAEVREWVLAERRKVGIYARVARKRNAANLDEGAVTVRLESIEPPKKRMNADAHGEQSASGASTIVRYNSGFDFDGAYYAPVQQPMPYHRPHWLLEGAGTAGWIWKMSRGTNERSYVHGDL